MAIRTLSLFDSVDQLMVEMNNRIDRATKELPKTIENIKKETFECIQAVEKNRQALALLSGAGFEVNTYYYDKLSYYTLDLGYFSNTKTGNARLAKTVRKVRLILDCHLDNAGKSLDNSKTRRLKYRLQPTEYPSLKVVFYRKLPKVKAGEPVPKCRIVTQRSTYKTLVCDV